MVTDERHDGPPRTPAVLWSTAQRLEEIESTLHASADALPDDAARRRLHARANEVTAEAERIAGRASRLSEQSRH